MCYESPTDERIYINLDISNNSKVIAALHKWKNNLHLFPPRGMIWRNVCKYLKLCDLLRLRRTNKLFYDQVCDSESFKTQMAIHMTTESLMDENFRDFLIMFPKWKSLIVTLHDTTKREENLIASYHPVILEAELTRLKFCWRERLGYSSSLTLGSVVFGVIARAPQLTKFEIEFVLLAQIQFWRAGFQATEFLMNVTDFKIFQGKLSNFRHRFQANCFKFNIIFLQKIFWQLKHLTIEELPDIGVDLNVRLQLLIRNNCVTLESLVLLYPSVWHKFRMGQTICPRLKKLRTITRLGYYNGSYFKDFLTCQPPLEDISIFVDGSFDKELVTIIQRNHCRNLKALHIKTNELGNGNSQLTLEFLENTSLQEFSFIMNPRPGHESTFDIKDCESLLQHLPPTIQKLKFEGFNLRPTPTFGENRLNFSRLAKCTFLSTLEFVKCTGLSGNRRWINDLNRLKGLRNLVMSHLGLADQDVAALKVYSLESLDISGNHELSPTAIQTLISQNSDLKSLISSQQGTQ